jgi:hypothetical protein
MEIEFDADVIVTLKDILDLTKDVDPSKVVIDINFEVPDWTNLVLRISE